MKIKNTLISIAAIGILYAAYTGIANKQIRDHFTKGTSIDSYVFILPGNNDEYINKSLEQFNANYSRQLNNVQFGEALDLIRFVRNKKPQRLEDISYSVIDKFMKDKKFFEAGNLSIYTDNQVIMDKIIGQAVDSLIKINNGKDAYFLCSYCTNKDQLYDKILRETKYPPKSKPLTEEEQKLVEKNIQAFKESGGTYIYLPQK